MAAAPVMRVRRKMVGAKPSQEFVGEAKRIVLSGRFDITLLLIAGVVTFRFFRK